VKEEAMNTEIRKSEENTQAAEVTQPDAFLPPVDIFESPDEYLLVADMPGVDPSKITVRLDQDTLVVEGDSAVAGFDPLRYRRAFRVMRGLEPEAVKADYKLGVLTVHLPKPASHKPRRITVTAS